MPLNFGVSARLGDSPLEDAVRVLADAGIEVAASNVTIDLNGFTLRGAPSSLAAVAVTSESWVTKT